jgi:sarcosine oxidase
MAGRVDTVIVGAGALGASAAWQLADRGAEVLLLEQGQGAALAEGPAEAFGRQPFLVATSDPVRLAMLREAVPFWHELEHRSASHLIDARGAVLHGAAGDLDELAEQVRRFGFEAEVLPAEEAEERFEGARFEERALVTAQAGSIDAAAAVGAVRTAAEAAGAHVRYGHRVTRLRVVGDDEVRVEVHSEENGGEEIVAHRAVVAAGAWTSKLLGRVLALPHLIVGRSQPTLFGSPAPARSPASAHSAASGSARDTPPAHHLPVLTHRIDPGARRHRLWPGSLDTVTAPGGLAGLRWRDVGKVADPDAGPSRLDPRQRTAYQRYVREWLPGLAAEVLAETQTTFVKSSDSQFVIDRIGPVVVGAGLPDHDLAFAPAIGRILADLAEGDGDTWGPARFSLLPSRRDRS